MSISSSSYSLTPVGFVHSSRISPSDDDWDKEAVYIKLTEEFSPSSLSGLTDFSHVELIFLMNQVSLSSIELNERHPRNRLDWPKVGIFAQRGKNRPNRLGISVCKIMKVENNKLYLIGLDAIDSTPVIDIKPWVKEFGPRGEVKQPKWMDEIMREYWMKQPEEEQRK